MLVLSYNPNYQSILKELKPSNSYHGVTNERVEEIKGDGSLYSSGAIEIVTIGDNGSFEDQRDALWKIEKAMLDKGYYTDSQTGQHMSLLLQKNFQIPEIVMKNVFQLTRMFLPEITYLVSTGVNPNINEGVIRKSAKEYANWKSGTLNAVNHSFKEVKDSYNKQTSAGGKYGFFNISKSHLMPDSSDCGEFFIEYRIPDRCMSPTISIAWGSMFKALVLKACSLSKYGVANISEEDYKTKKQQCDELFTKDRQKILKDKNLKAQVNEFLDFLTIEFKNMNELKALKVLQHITKTPLFSNKYYLTSKQAEKIKEPLWFSIEQEMNNLINPKQTFTAKDLQIRQSLEEGIIGTKTLVFDQILLQTKLTTNTLNTRLKTLGLKYDGNYKTFI